MNQPLNLQPIVILNVDDHELNRYAKSKILRDAGFVTLEAGMGEQALRIADEAKPDLVLLDVQLPDISGMEVCRRLRLDEATANLPVVHISATYTSQDAAEGSLRSGADIFLAEPVEPEELVTVVRTLARLRRSEAGLAASEARMRMATEGAGIGTWEVDLEAGTGVWNSRLYELLGYSHDIKASWAAWEQRINPADLPATRAAMEHAQHDGKLFSNEHRIIREDGGDERWLSVYGRVQQDNKGQYTRFLGIALDVTEKKRLELNRERMFQLEQAARERAEKASRLQDEFLAMLSHELRTPMNAVMGWLQLLRKGVLTPEKQAEALEIIERNARLQNELIKDLLDVSGIIAGKLQLEPSQVMVQDILKLAVESAIPPARSKDVAIELEALPTGPIQADPARLQQVFGNLLSNAVKFTPQGGVVKVRLERKGGFVSISVSDNGEGMEPELLPHLFERFLQGDRSRTRRHGGLGLGLAIARSVVEAHGGRIFAASEGLGKGATFTVMLPIRVPEGLAQPRVEPRTDSQLSGEIPSLEGVRVLVTDDDPASRHLLEHALERQGASVRGAEQAETALQIFREWRPDIMMLDIGMPDMDGYDLLRRMYAAAGHSRAMVPAIAVTGYARPEDREQAMRAGFKAHVTKPFVIDDVLRLVGRLLKGA